MSIAAGSDILASDFDYLFASPQPYLLKTAPSASWKICDGSAISRSTYATSFGILVPSLGTFTVTIATPGVFTLNSHGLIAGDQVYLTTTGALPTGLSQNTIYYVIAAGLTSNAFELSTSRGGSAINTTGSQSGTHTCRYCPYGLGDGTTTFNLPDMRQRSILGFKTGDTYVGYIGQTGGEQTHVLTSAEMPAHTHAYGDTAVGGASAAIQANISSQTQNNLARTTG